MIENIGAYSQVDYDRGYQQGYRQALADNYNTLANELKWVIDKFGSDAYMDIRTSVCLAQDKLTK